MDVLMPQLGETVKDGKISSWFKQQGDPVAAGDNLFEIETDKVSMEVQAIESGILSAVYIGAGETVDAGTVLAFIDNGSGAIAVKPQASKPANAAAHEATAKHTASEIVVVSAAPARSAAPGISLEARGFAPFNEVFTPTGNFGPAKMPDGMRVSPLARRLIKQNNLDAASIAAQVRAAGRDKVSASDVQNTLASPAVARTPAAPLAPISGERDIEPLNRIRQQTGRHLQNSWQQVPHVLQTVEVDFGYVDAIRQQRKDLFRKAHGTSLTFLPFIARAICLALRAWPKVNAAFDGEKLHIARAINLGFAVDLDHQGLVVPVVKNADGLNVAGMAQAINAIAQKARDGKLTPDDMEGGTYSISNNGSFGTLFTMPLINAPQVAILSIDAIRKRALVKETEFGDIIVARPAGILAQSFDHRAFDGAYSASFLNHLKTILETRDWSAEFN
ncbi:MAG: 2-oxo acid dehydrogenase subunit E2 [Beijerinckiaceae bacterium]|jgi:pyruvate dehydrogenase E2 component (dihydrolipoamide acetyltransferase)|nr:2-oxo acid dehydrogenase subunit E2 [Beijerinckiaceae bacterium]